MLLEAEQEGLTPFIELSEKVLEAANRGAAQAIEVHRRMGRSIVIMREGKIVHIKPEELTPRSLPGDEE